MLSLRSYPAFILTAHFQSVISYSLGSYISSLVTLYASVLSLFTIQVSQLSQSVGSDATPVPHNYCLMEFEAENGVTSGQTMQRSRASGGLSVSLTRAGQHVTHTFSTYCLHCTGTQVFSTPTMVSLTSYKCHWMELRWEHSGHKRNQTMGMTPWLDMLDSEVALLASGHLVTYNYSVRYDTTQRPIEMACRG